MPTRPGRRDRDALFRRDPEEVEDVGEGAVLDEQRVPAEARALGDDDALALTGEVDLGEDLERDVVGVGGELLGHLGGPGVVGVPAGGRRGHSVEDAARAELVRCHVVQRQDVVPPRLVHPEPLQLLDLLGMLVGDVVGLGAVLVGVEELPVVVLEAPGSRDRAVLGDGLPALVPDAPVTHHLVVLGLLAGGSVPLERVGHRDARQRRLLVTVDHLRHLHTAGLQDGRVDVGGVVVLAADLAADRDAGQEITSGSHTPPW